MALLHEQPAETTFVYLKLKMKFFAVWKKWWLFWFSSWDESFPENCHWFGESFSPSQDFSLYTYNCVTCSIDLRSHFRFESLRPSFSFRLRNSWIGGALPPWVSQLELLKSYRVEGKAISRGVNVGTCNSFSNFVWVCCFRCSFEFLRSLACNPNDNALSPYFYTDTWFWTLSKWFDIYFLIS